MLSRRRSTGFSIIELSVALTIAGILLALGAPSLAGYIQNARLGSTAKSFYNGLTLARSEAIRMNRPVEFAMTNSAVASGIENTLTTDGAGKNWVVRYQPTANGTYALVEAKTALEGGGSAPSIVVAASTPAITFTGLGQSTVGSDAAIMISNPPSGQCAPLGPVRCWNVLASPGGRIRLCDPAALAGDSRAC